MSAAGRDATGRASLMSHCSESRVSTVSPEHGLA